MRSSHGTAVNIYIVKKMFDMSSIDETRDMLRRSYENSDDRDKLTFDEWVDRKRNFAANILGKLEYC